MNNAVEKAFPTVWNDLLENRHITPQDKPLGIVLGGVPGSGKSILIEKIEKELNKNIIPINGDDFRIYHPNFKEIYAEHKGDFPKYTSEFSNKMVERVIEEAIKNKFNIVVEGTFRNSNVPIGTLSKFEEQGYNTRAMIIATDKHIAWESTINRYNQDLENGFYARKVDRSSFDEVVANLAKNTKIVLDSGKASLLEVYSREAKLFDSKIDNPANIEETINRELNGLNQGIPPIKAQYESKLATLSTDQQQKARLYEQQAFNTMQYMPAEFHEKTQQAIYENQIDLIHDGKYHAPDVDLKSIEYTQESSAQTSDWEMER